MTSSYYRGAQGVVLGELRLSCLEFERSLGLTGVVYDVTSRPTFDELLRWFRELDTYCGEGVVKVLVGNKVDKVRVLLLYGYREADDVK